MNTTTSCGARFIPPSYDHFLTSHRVPQAVSVDDSGTKTTGRLVSDGVLCERSLSYVPSYDAEASLLLCEKPLLGLYCFSCHLRRLANCSVYVWFICKCDWCLLEFPSSGRMNCKRITVTFVSSSLAYAVVKYLLMAFVQ